MARRAEAPLACRGCRARPCLSCLVGMHYHSTAPWRCAGAPSPRSHHAGGWPPIGSARRDSRREESPAPPASRFGRHPGGEAAACGWLGRWAASVMGAGVGAGPAPAGGAAAGYLKIEHSHFRQQRRPRPGQRHAPPPPTSCHARPRSASALGAGPGAGAPAAAAPCRRPPLGHRNAGIRPPARRGGGRPERARGVPTRRSCCTAWCPLPVSIHRVLSALRRCPAGPRSCHPGIMQSRRGQLALRAPLGLPPRFPETSRPFRGSLRCFGLLLYTPFPSPGHPLPARSPSNARLNRPNLPERSLDPGCIPSAWKYSHDITFGGSSGFAGERRTPP